MTDYHNIVRLVLKLFGIVLIVYGAVSLATYLPGLLVDRGVDNLVGYLPFILPLVVPFIAGALLWFFPAMVANTVVRLDSSERDLRSGWLTELERVGVSLLGIFLFYRAVSDIIYHVMTYQARETVSGNVRMPDDFSALVTVTLVELILALVLMLRSKGILNLLKKARGY